MLTRSPSPRSTRSPSHNKGVLFKHVHGTKEGWGSETCYQPQISKQICEIRALKDGRPTHSQGPHTEEQLDGQSRPQRCLLYGPSCTSTSPPSLQPRKEDIPIQMSSLRTVYTPKSVHQNPQANHREAEINGFGGSVHGRYTHHGNCC